MNTRRSQELSRNRRAGFQYLSLALGALLAFQPAALAAAVSLRAADAAIPAQAGFTYVVNRTGDAAGVGPTSGCDTDIITPGSQCTLRAALRSTNASAGDDTITFNIPATDPGCDATTGKCVINLNQALPDITDSVAINGPGADKLTVRRDTNSSSLFSIFSGYPSPNRRHSHCKEQHHRAEFIEFGCLRCFHIGRLQLNRQYGRQHGLYTAHRPDRHHCRAARPQARPTREQRRAYTNPCSARGQPRQ